MKHTTFYINPEVVTTNQQELARLKSIFDKKPDNKELAERIIELEAWLGWANSITNPRGKK